MASVHRRGDKWRVIWREGGRQRGRTFTKLLGPGGAKEFAATAEAREQRPRRATAIDPGISFREYAARWLPLVQPTLEPATWAGYAVTVSRHLDPFLGDARVRDVSRGTVKELIATKRAALGRSGKPLSVETVRGIHAVLRIILEWARDDGIIDDNPAARSMGRKLGLVRSRRQRQEDKHPFSEEERDLFHASAATTDRRLADLFFTLERAGLRLGEGLALRLADVNLKRRELRIERSVSAFDRSTKAPKSGHGRTVEIGEQLAAVLVRVTGRRRREGIKAGDLNPLLFPSEAKKPSPYHHGNVEKRFKRALKAAGLPDHHTPHDLRHTYATLLLERGVDMNWLKDQLGHASIQMTVDEYGRWAKPRKGLASLLDSTSSPLGVANAGGLLPEGRPARAPDAVEATDAEDRE